MGRTKKKASAPKRSGLLVKLFSEARLDQWKRALYPRLGRVRLLRSFVDRVALWDAEEIPRVLSGEVVWRSKHGPRRHALKPADPRRANSAAWSVQKSGRKPRWGLVGAKDLETYLVGVAIVKRWGESEWPEIRRGPWPEVLAVGAREALSSSGWQLLDEASQAGVTCLVWIGSRDAVELLSSISQTEPCFEGLPESVIIASESHADLEALGATGGRRGITLGPPTSPFLLTHAPRDPIALLGPPSEAEPLAAVDQISARIAAFALPGVPKPSFIFVSEEAARSSQGLRRTTEAMLEGATLCRIQASETGLLHGAPGVSVQSPADLGEWLRGQGDRELASLTHASARFARRVLAGPASRRRLLFHTGLPAAQLATPSITVICVSRRPELLPSVLRTFASFDYPNKRLVCVVNQDLVDEREVERIVRTFPDVVLLRTTSSMSLGESLNRARSLTATELWAKLDDDDYYGPNYLRDSVEALLLSEADVVGKGTYFLFSFESRGLYFRSETPAYARSDRFVHGGTIVARTESTRDITFHPVVRGTDSLFLQECKLKGLSIYSADPFNFAYIRYDTGGHHTFDVPTNQVLAKAQLIACPVDVAIVDC